MSKIFTRTFRVRWGELDASGAAVARRPVLILNRQE
jgi:acyl-CoA thioesterase FadM